MLGDDGKTTYLLRTAKNRMTIVLVALVVVLVGTVIWIQAGGAE